MATWKDSNNQKQVLHLVPANEEEGASIQGTFDSTEVPLLVPAWSREALEETIYKYPFLFQGLGVAGLVPGVSGARCDIDALLWTEAPAIDWTFEVKARSDSYSANQGVIDLTRKARESNRASCHAMLVAFNGEPPSECLVWTEGEKLRVVLVLAYQMS